MRLSDGAVKYHLHAARTRRCATPSSVGHERQRTRRPRSGLGRRLARARARRCRSRSRARRDASAAAACTHAAPGYAGIECCGGVAGVRLGRGVGLESKHERPCRRRGSFDERVADDGPNAQLDHDRHGSSHANDEPGSRTLDHHASRRRSAAARPAGRTGLAVRVTARPRRPSPSRDSHTYSSAGGSVTVNLRSGALALVSVPGRAGLHGRGAQHPNRRHRGAIHQGRKRVAGPGSAGPRAGRAGNFAALNIRPNLPVPCVVSSRQPEPDQEASPCAGPAQQSSPPP